MIDDQLITKIVCRLFPATEAIYLFGSQADGTATEGSDVDLAVLVQPAPDAEVAFRAKAELAGALKRDIDFVDLWRADTVTAAQVISTGVRIFAKIPYEANAFETFAFSRYALLNEERKDIIADIMKRGSVYG